MKITADQLLKIAGIVPTTTLRTRLNESATVTNEATSSSEMKRLQAEAKSISDKIDDIVEDGGTVSLTDPLNIKLRKIRAEMKKMKNTKEGMKEGMEGPYDDITETHGLVGDALKQHIDVIVDMALDDGEEEGLTPEQVVARAVEAVKDMLDEAATEPGALRHAVKRLGQGAQAYDDDGMKSRQRQLNV